MLFSHIDHEESVQANDRTRLDVSKCFGTQDETLTALYVSPSMDVDLIAVYDTSITKRFLDWEYDFGIDIDATNDKFDIEVLGTQYAATLTQDTYTLGLLADELEAQLNGLGTGLIFTVAFDLDDKITIAADGVFDILLDGPNKLVTLARELYLGDEDELDNLISYTGDRVERLKRKISVVVGEDVAQRQTITTVADVAGSLNNDYFFIWSSSNETKYYVWFNVASGGTDPSIPDSIGVEVAISTGATASAVATAVATALDALVDFSATSISSVVTVMNALNGSANDAKEGVGTGFTFVVTAEGQASVIDTSHIYVYSETGDCLFSNDSDLEIEEPLIRRYTKPGRNTFKDVHRAVQTKILEWLDRQGYVNIFDKKYTKWDFVDKKEIAEWARYTALLLVFEGFRNQGEDVFKLKREYYSTLEIAARSRAILRIDTNSDGNIDELEGLNTSSTRLLMR